MLKTILAITGKPGLFKFVNRGKNMLIVESLDAAKKRQPAYATDKVVALSDISIYTNDDAEVPLASVFENIQKEYEGKAMIGTADVDECNDLAAKFRIRNVPTVLFFKGGSDQPVDKSVGLVAKETLAEKLNALL